MAKAGVRPNLQCRTAALAACGSAGRWREAIELWEAIVQDARGDGDGGSPSPDRVCASTALQACVEASAWRAGLRVVDQLYDLPEMPSAEMASPEATAASEMGGSRIDASDGEAGGGGVGAAEEASGPFSTAAPRLHGLSARELNDQLNRVCVILDSLRRHGERMLSSACMRTCPWARG